MILLKDEEMELLVADDTWEREIWEYGKEYLDKTNKAQLKKVVVLLNECCTGLDLEHPEYYENQGFVVFPAKYLQSLLKEVED